MPPLHHISNGSIANVYCVAHVCIPLLVYWHHTRNSCILTVKTLPEANVYLGYGMTYSRAIDYCSSPLPPLFPPPPSSSLHSPDGRYLGGVLLAHYSLVRLLLRSYSSEESPLRVGQHGSFSKSISLASLSLSESGLYVMDPLPL